MNKLNRTVLVIFGIVGTLIAILLIYVQVQIQRSFPQTAGEIQIDGLSAPVDIYRDEAGIPHIYASTSADLFFAQGYVHAQDRFWQMDMWRHQGAGRLSELLGEPTIEVDKFLQTLGWERVSQAELDSLDPETLGLLEAYASGVNAYLAAHSGSAVSLEYLFLGIINSDYTPQPWTSLNTLTWTKAMAWDLGSNMDSELDRARLLADLSPDDVAFLLPGYPFDRHPVIVSDPHLTAAVDSQPVTWQDTGLQTLFAGLSQDVQSLDAFRNKTPEGMGSNSWAISGARTESGLPILANDPHLGLQLPSIWYEVGLHCLPKAETCPYEVSGFSFAGAPGIVIGHNDRIAWGFTNINVDVQDIYIEKINPDNPNQYEFQGEWLDMELLPTAIHVAGADSIEMTVRLTHHGPLLTDVAYDDFAEESGLELPENFGLSLRWTALEPGRIFQALLGINRAQNFDEFQAAASLFDVPAQNLIYADVDGNIGYQTPGRTPIRSEQHDGLVPVPGWTGDFEWQGFVPFGDLPFTINPPAGYIVTANNAIVGPEYPYPISREWDLGYRASRITEVIESRLGPISVSEMMALQGDNHSPMAELLLPELLNAIGATTVIDQQALNDLAEWDYHASLDSSEAAIWQVFWKHLLAETFQDDIPEYYWPSGGDRWLEILKQMLAEPQHAWWDDSRTAVVEDRDAIFERAFSLAVSELSDQFGDNQDLWRWGELHTTTFVHPVMDNFPVINGLFNRGPFETAGGSDMLNATGWSTLSPFGVRSIPSMRMVVDLSDLANSFTIHSLGQSGHAGHTHYADLVEAWRLIEFHPMYWGQANIVDAAADHLRLVP
jgi:penicillin amidase